MNKSGPRIFTFLAIILHVYLCISVSEAHHGDDNYSPVIRYLKELRRARKYGLAATSGVLPIKNGVADSSGNTQASEAIQDSGAIRVGVGGTPSDAGKRQADANTQAQLEQTLQQISSQLPTQPPYPIERVNEGLRTLLGGVNSLNLGDILRGSFTFTRNENVRSVANTVIDSIFGAKPAESSAPITPPS